VHRSLHGGVLLPRGVHVADSRPLRPAAPSVLPSGQCPLHPSLRRHHPPQPQLPPRKVLIFFLPWCPTTSTMLTFRRAFTLRSCLLLSPPDSLHPPTLMPCVCRTRRPRWWCRWATTRARPQTLTPPRCSPFKPLVRWGRIAWTACRMIVQQATTAAPANCPLLRAQGRVRLGKG
jgi:hypothetical protein